MANEVFSPEFIEGLYKIIDSYNNDRYESQTFARFYGRWRELPELQEMLENATTAQHIAYIQAHLYNKIAENNTLGFAEMAKGLRKRIVEFVRTRFGNSETDTQAQYNTICSDLSGHVNHRFDHLAGDIDELEGDHFVATRTHGDAIVQECEFDFCETACFNYEMRKIHEKEARISAYLSALIPDNDSTCSFEYVVDLSDPFIASFVELPASPVETVENLG